MITLKEAAAVASEFERLPESMETLRRWTRRKIISRSSEDVFHGGDVGRETFYPDQIIAEIITTIRLKNNHGFTLEEIKKTRNVVQSGLVAKKQVNEYGTENTKKLKSMQTAFSRFKEHEQSQREEIASAAASGADVEELQEKINKLKRLKDFRRRTVKYSEVYLKVLDDLETRELSKAN